MLRVAGYEPWGIEKLKIQDKNWIKGKIHLLWF